MDLRKQTMERRGMNTAHSADSKQEARSKAIAARAAIPDEMRIIKSQAIAKKLSSLLEESHRAYVRSIDRPDLTSSASFCVAVYSAFPKEVDLTPFIKDAYASHVRVAFPCMTKTGQGSEMIMRSVSHAAWRTEEAPFVISPIKSFAIDDSRVQPFKVVAPEEIDMIVVPMVAYDETHNRLGYGGGNYDRFLPRLKDSCVIVGVAFVEQHLPGIPRESTDIPLKAIYTA